LFATGLSHPGRRRFWQIFARYAATHPDREPSQSNFDGFLAETAGEAARDESGSVTLVGAGPGDPELLTLRAVRALQSADIILLDDLVAPDILDFARREAKKMLVGKTGHGPSCKQEEINALMVTLARTGKRVVRLKGGDPMIFGRATEEIAACRVAGVPVEVVPGISAAQGAASRLCVSLTHREGVRRLQYVTGHASDGHLPADIDWKSIADPGATTIVYMPVKTYAAFAGAAIAAGLDAATPAVAVISATRPDETVIAATLESLPHRLARTPMPGPAVVMIGRLFASVASADAASTPSASRAAG
jgi:uroporphyrin-III C-methyltransferase/precorrin-2 dehydrogenase/sirohydrochlorin ferrochelatase